MRNAPVLATASTLNPSKAHHYIKATTELKEELARAVPRDELRRLHERSTARHAVVTLRQVLILAVCSWALVRFSNPLVWIPLAVVQGFTIFNFTVLLHEVVHETVSPRHRPWLTRLLGVMYAFPSGISHLQFTRWHLDHHDNLGSS